MRVRATEPNENPRVKIAEDGTYSVTFVHIATEVTISPMVCRSVEVSLGIDPNLDEIVIRLGRTDDTKWSTPK